MRALPLKLEPFPCGYFDDRKATYDHYLLEEVGPNERQALLDLGYRSFGKYFFRPICQGCQRCVPIRVPLHSFHASKSQRRVSRKCAAIEVRVQTPSYTKEKYEIYLDHRLRFPNQEQDSSAEGFRSSFYEPTKGALEFTYYLDGKLLAVGLVNETPSSLSSAYFFYRHEVAHLSLGTFSILKEIEYGLSKGKKFLYLGYYIYKNHFMRYKADYRPNQILSDGRGWIPFHESKGKEATDPNASWPPCDSPLWQARFSHWPKSGDETGHGD